MNKKTLKVLEYYKIIELLKNEADSDVGREIISELVPLMLKIMLQWHKKVELWQSQNCLKSYTT